MKCAQARLHLKQLAIAAVFVAWFVGTLHGTTVLPMSFEQLVADAVLVFEGETIQTVARRAENGSIYTDVTFRVIRVLKGGADATIAVAFLGGTIGDVTMGISDLPKFKTGDHDVLFLHGRREISPIVGAINGRFPVVHDQASGDVFVRGLDGRPIKAVAEIAGIGTVQHRLSTQRPLALRDFETAILSEVARQRQVR